MRITDFASKVAKMEGGKKEVNIAQICDILKAINSLTKGFLYIIIRGLK